MAILVFFFFALNDIYSLCTLIEKKSMQTRILRLDKSISAYGFNVINNLVERQYQVSS